MITCRELVELLLDFVADDLPPESRRRIEEHLCHCQPCVTYVETYQLTIKLTRRLPCDPLPQGLEQRLRIVLQQVYVQKKPKE